MKNKQITSIRLVAILGTAILTTGLIILILAFTPKSTVVELTIRAKQVSLTVLPPPPPTDSILLLDESLKVHSLKLRNVYEFKANLVELGYQPVKLQPIIDGGRWPITLESDSDFQPSVTLSEKTHLTIQPSQDNRVVLSLKQQIPENTERQSWVEAYGNLQLKLDGVKISSAPGLNLNPQNSYKITDYNSPLFIADSQREVELGLRLVLAEKRFPTLMHVLDIPSGQVLESKNLPLALQEQHVMSTGERLILLLKDAIDEPSIILLDKNLNVRKPEFYRFSGSQEESYLIGGQIRFPAKERETLELERDFLLEVKDTEPLKLKSIELKNGHLQLVLWGKPSSLTYGPTPDLMAEILPSCFIWLYTHKLGTLAFSTISWIVVSFIAALKLFGIMKPREN